MTKTASDSKRAVYHHCDACGAGITTDDAPVECAACRPPDILHDVHEFHEKFGLAYAGKPRTLPEDVVKFRIKFMEEELNEYQEAVEAVGLSLHFLKGRTDDEARAIVTELLAKQLDALVDLTYVAVGCADLQGFDFAAAWRRVHAANMAKVRAKLDGSDSARRSSHDVVKPPGWVAPDHTDLVCDHEELG